MELATWEPTLHGAPWRMITGAEPDAIKVACPVLNGEDEETGRKALRLVLTQLPRSRFQARLIPSVRRICLRSQSNRNLLASR